MISNNFSRSQYVDDFKLNLVLTHNHHHYTHRHHHNHQFVLNFIRSVSIWISPLINWRYGSIYEVAEGMKSSVTMKETGTEMTPMASHEPSRTATPNGACTPSRSPAGSTPQTPRAVPPPGSPPAAEELSDEERRMKTRREILALGLQLGKMNIAAWASKADEAAVRPWVEAEKTKHNAR